VIDLFEKLMHLKRLDGYHFEWEFYNLHIPRKKETAIEKEI